MARAYAKVSMELYGDDKFLRLTPVKPSGQSLWIYLLTGSFRTAIPGLSVRIGMGALSDRLGWPMSAVKRHWREIDDSEMAMADWRAGVVFLPNGIAHNEPESTNVVRSWGKVVLPECELVTIAKQSLRGYLARNLTEAFAKAFDETFGEVGRQPSANQEQEQEQEQERTIVQTTERSELARRHLVRELLAEHERLFVERYGHKPAKYTGKDAKHAKDLVDQHGFDEACVMLRAFFGSRDQFIAQCGHGLGPLASGTVQNKLIAEMSGLKPMGDGLDGIREFARHG